MCVCGMDGYVVYVIVCGGAGYACGVAGWVYLEWMGVG